MASAYYSTIFHEPAAEIWKIIRDFNNYPIWVGGAGESRIEDGKSGDAVGAVRHVLYQGRQIRQRLLALSDVERAQTYEFCDSPSLPVTSFQAPCASPRSSTATAPLSNGGRISIAKPPAEMSSLEPCAAGLPNGSNRCGAPSLLELAAKR
jgi:hypothetical protein